MADNLLKKFELIKQISKDFYLHTFGNSQESKNMLLQTSNFCDNADCNNEIKNALDILIQAHKENDQSVMLEIVKEDFGGWNIEEIIERINFSYKYLIEDENFTISKSDYEERYPLHNYDAEDNFSEVYLKQIGLLDSKTNNSSKAIDILVRKQNENKDLH